MIAEVLGKALSIRCYIPEIPERTARELLAKERPTEEILKELAEGLQRQNPEVIAFESDSQTPPNGVVIERFIT